MKKTKLIHAYGLRMVLYVTILFCMSIFISACANANKSMVECKNDFQWMLVDSALAKCLPDSLTQSLFNSDTIKCYHILSKDTIEKKDIQVVKGYVRDSLLALLNESQASVLRYLLISNPACYSEDSMHVQSPYFPLLEFQFKKQGNPTTSIVISPIDRSWQMIVEGKQISSYNYVNSKAIERYCNYFINLDHKNE